MTLLAWLACLPALVLAAAPADVTHKPMNVVMILTDDLDMDVWQSGLAQGYYPNVSHYLLNQGTTFDNAFVTESLCCPTRSTLLNGQYAHNHGVIRDVGPRGGFHRFRDAASVAVLLHDAGYRTGLMGKYLNGYKKHADYVPPGWDTWDAVLDVEEYNYGMSVNGVVRQYGSADADYQTDVIANLASDFILQQDARPFYLELTPTAPHYENVDQDDGSDVGKSGTVRPPQRYLDTPALPTIPSESRISFNEPDMSDKPQWMRSLKPLGVDRLRTGFNSRLGAMRAVDDLVGKVYAALRQTGHVADTAVIFTSDNGFQYGPHRRQEKQDFYEESSRIPMAMRIGNLGATQHVAQPVLSNDWAPTILDLAHVTPPAVMDGQSVKSLVLGQPSFARHSLLVEMPVDPSDSGAHPAFDAIRTSDPALTFDASGATVLVYALTRDPKGAVTDKEFYDLGVDPFQVQSLHLSTDPTRLKQMKALDARLQKLEVCAGDTCHQLEQ